MLPSKRPWRTLIRIGRFVRKPNVAPVIQLVIPGWDPKIIVGLQFRTLPKEIRDAIVDHFSKSKDGFRCYAEVNIGAERWEDLRFKEWELGEHDED